MTDRRIHLVGALLVLAAFAPALRAEVVNGSFEDALPLDQSWNVRDVVQVEPTGLGHVAFFEEPGTGGVSELWQAVQIPSTASLLTFRYRFASPPDTVAPQLLAAYSRKVHGSTNPVTLDLDVLAGETECRSETIDLDTTDLTIVAKFDRRVALLGLPGGENESKPPQHMCFFLPPWGRIKVGARNNQLPCGTRPLGSRPELRLFRSPRELHRASMTPVESDRVCRSNRGGRRSFRERITRSKRVRTIPSPAGRGLG